jgi:enterochelin esterase-like enzyme
MKNLLFLFLSIFTFAQTPKVSSGKLIEYKNFKSENIGERTVRIWLPKNYNPAQKYQVLYANDGQMLWDASINWNKQEWKLDEVLGKLIEDKSVKPTIVVAIDNAGKNRHSEYFPQKPFESLPKKTQDSLYTVYRNKDQILFNEKVYSDKYLKFLVEELKPFVDKNYATFTDYKHTFIMGSSMGGLISMYAACEYPEVFGGAICMSTHWIGTFTAEKNPIPELFFNYLDKNLPTSKTHQFYFDFGTETLDAQYEPFQKRADAIMKKHKYKNRNWQTLKFPGEEHSEKSWAKRLDIPLTFMLK